MDFMVRKFASTGTDSPAPSALDTRYSGRAYPIKTSAGRREVMEIRGWCFPTETARPGTVLAGHSLKHGQDSVLSLLSTHASGLQFLESRIEGVAHSPHCFDEPEQGFGPAFLVTDPDFMREVD